MSPCGVLGNKLKVLGMTILCLKLQKKKLVGTSLAFQVSPVSSNVIMCVGGQ